MTPEYKTLREALPPIPQALYSCNHCGEEYSKPAFDLHWSTAESAWVCNECWDENEVKGICLKDRLASILQPDEQRVQELEVELQEIKTKLINCDASLHINGNDMTDLGWLTIESVNKDCMKRWGIGISQYKDTAALAQADTGAEKSPGWYTENEEMDVVSETPETDAQEHFINDIDGVQQAVVDSDFARTLERQRNSARAEVERLREELLFEKSLVGVRDQWCEEWLQDLQAAGCSERSLAGAIREVLAKLASLRVAADRLAEALVAVGQEAQGSLPSHARIRDIISATHPQQKGDAHGS